MMRLVPLLAGLAAMVAAEAEAATACQPLSVGVNTLKGVLHAAPAGASSQFMLQLDRPLCARELAAKVAGSAAAQLTGRVVFLTFPGGDPRRFVGRRVLVSGALLNSKTSNGAVLQVGSFAPLPQVAANVS